MRQIWFLPFLLGAVLVTPLSAQRHRPGTVGLGIGLDAVPNTVTSVFGFDADGRTGMILVPVQVATRIRLQPALCYWRFSHLRVLLIFQLQHFLNYAAFIPHFLDQPQ